MHLDRWTHVCGTRGGRHRGTPPPDGTTDRGEMDSEGEGEPPPIGASEFPEDLRAVLSGG